MGDKRALFILLDQLVTPDGGIPSGVVRRLMDFRSWGYLVVGLSHTPLKIDIDKSGLNILHIILKPDLWRFPEYAWLLARRYCLDLSVSLLCSPITSHIEWVRDAGLKRLEDPKYLLLQ
jgi:hypothetical protein